MSETGRLPPSGRETILAASENILWLLCVDGLCLHCACIMLATRGGDTGHEGHRREPRSKPPPHRASTRGTAARGAAKKGGANRKGAAPPPPPPADKCRVTCSHRARNVHAPEERTTLQIPAASKNSGYCVVMEYACIVRASCLPPAAGTRGTKGTGGSQKANPPPQSEHEGNRGERGGQEGQSEQKRRQPPPPGTSAAPRACIVLATCMPRRKGQHEPPPPPQPLRKGTRAARGRNLKERQEKWGGGHRGEHRAGESDGRQAVRAKGRHERPQPEPGPETDMQSARAGKKKSGGRERGTSKTRHEPGRAERSAGRGENKGREQRGRGQHSGRGRSGRNGPTGDAGKGPSLSGLGAPPVTVSAPPEHTQ